MAVEHLEVIKQQLSALTTQEKVALGNYLLEQAIREMPVPTTNEATPEAKRAQQIDWLKANRARYGGLYVALDGDVLLGTGANFVEAAQAAHAAGVKNAFIDFVPPPDYVGSTGDW